MLRKKGVQTSYMPSHDIALTRSGPFHAPKPLYSVFQSVDRGLLAAGYLWEMVGGSPKYDILLVKLNSTGTTMQWARRIGGTNDDYAYTNALQMSDGSYLVGAITTSFGAGIEDIYLVKLSSIGNVEWTRTIGGTGFEWPSGLLLNPDGTMMVASRTSSFGNGNRDLYLVKLQSDGQSCCIRSAGGTVTTPNITIQTNIFSRTNFPVTLTAVTPNVTSGGNLVYHVVRDFGEPSSHTVRKSRSG
jgi:hypothetical protein